MRLKKHDKPEERAPDLKVIFLDIDGVLVTYGDDAVYYNGTDMAFHRPCVECLNMLIAETGCKIVISSAWRLSQKLSLPVIFREEGVIGEIIGVTPSLGNRGQEIATWLNAAAGRVTSFVIIDDADRGISPLFPDRFVKTRGRTGFDPKGLANACRILASPYPDLAVGIFGN
jgi:hypothetical protein